MTSYKNDEQTNEVEQPTLTLIRVKVGAPAKNDYPRGILVGDYQSRGILISDYQSRGILISD